MLTRQFIGLLCLNLFMGTVMAQQYLGGDTSETRLDRLERQLTNFRQTLLEHESTISQLQREIKTLRGDKEVLLYELEQVKKQQEQIFLDLDQRLQKLQVEKSQSSLDTTNTAESATGVETVETPDSEVTETTDEDVTSAETTQKAPVVSNYPKTVETTAPTLPKTTPATPAVTGKVEDLTTASPATTEVDDSITPKLVGNEKQDYQTLFKLIQDGEYQTAVAGWQTFINRYPQSESMANAYYWLGEAQYTLQNYSAALSTFKTLRDKYQDHQKSQQALLKIGYIYYDQKHYEEAKTVWRQVKELYAGTTAARLAEQRLQQLPSQ